MKALKEEAIDIISNLPSSAQLDDIMYRLYVLEKIRKGKKAIEAGEIISIEELEKEVQTW